MSRTPGLRQLRRRKTTRLDRVEQQHEHTHALFRALVLAAVLVVLAVSGVLQRESSGVRATQAGASADVADGHSVAGSPARPVAASRSAPDVEYLPLVAVAAAYPAAAEAAGITGRCTVEFTVTASGTTDDVRAVDCTPVGVDCNKPRPVMPPRYMCSPFLHDEIDRRECCAADEAPLQHRIHSGCCRSRAWSSPAGAAPRRRAQAWPWRRRRAPARSRAASGRAA